jgi:heme/copper-type cytochrome/quinol oxidase subunit 2
MPALRRFGRTLGLATATLALGALLAGCGGDDVPSPESTDTKSKTLDVVIADGEVTPNAERVEVGVGTSVILQIRSDVADEIHVHGYDEEIAVEPGKPATLEFGADETGRYEIETHESHKLVYQLVVTP